MFLNFYFALTLAIFSQLSAISLCSFDSYRIHFLCRCTVAQPTILTKLSVASLGLFRPKLPRYTKILVPNPETQVKSSGRYTMPSSYTSAKFELQIIVRHQKIPTCKYHSFITHSVFCPTTGPKPPPKQFLHIVRSRAPSFK